MKKLSYVLIILLLCLIGVATYSYFSSYYTVMFITDGVGKQKKIKKGASIIDGEVPQKKGYRFLYWMDDNTIVDANYKVSNDAILVALFEEVQNKKVYTVSFDTDGGSTISNRVVKEDEKLIEPDEPTKEGYIFKEWSLDNKTYDFETPVKSNLLLKANYIKENSKTYTVSFDTDGGSRISSKVVEENGKVGRPSAPIKSGYKFQYWSLNGNSYNFDTPVTNNITLKAVYQIDQRKVYTVTFDSAGGSEIYSQSVMDKDKAVKPNDPIKSGYTFANWLLDNKIYDFSTPVTKNITLKALYVKLNSEVAKNSYVVNFDTDGGTKINYQLVQENEKVTKPTDPVKSGYSFVEWQLDGKNYDFNTPVNSVMTLRAIYSLDTVPATDIYIKEKNYIVEVGDKFNITAAVVPGNASNKTIKWESSDKSIATVDNGQVTALKEGTITITASVDNIEKMCTIMVKPSVNYTYEIEHNYIYVKANNKNTDGVLNITYTDGTSETITVTSQGYLLPDKPVASVTIKATKQQ